MRKQMEGENAVRIRDTDANGYVENRETIWGSKRDEK